MSITKELDSVGLKWEDSNAIVHRLCVIPHGSHGEYSLFVCVPDQILWDEFLKRFDEFAEDGCLSTAQKAYNYTCGILQWVGLLD